MALDLSFGSDQPVEGAQELMLDEEAKDATEFADYDSYVEAATQQLRAVILGELEALKVRVLIEVPDSEPHTSPKCPGLTLSSPPPLFLSPPSPFHTSFTFFIFVAAAVRDSRRKVV
jgi:hypothetical protein